MGRSSDVWGGERGDALAVKKNASGAPGSTEEWVKSNGKASSPPVAEGKQQSRSGRKSPTQIVREVLSGRLVPRQNARKEKGGERTDENDFHLKMARVC